MIKRCRRQWQHGHAMRFPECVGADQRSHCPIRRAPNLVISFEPCEATRFDIALSSDSFSAGTPSGSVPRTLAGHLSAKGAGGSYLERMHNWANTLDLLRLTFKTSQHLGKSSMGGDSR